MVYWEHLGLMMKLSLEYFLEIQLCKLPFEIPSSMSEVMDQLEDVPDDTKDPTFEIGFGLTYP